MAEAVTTPRARVEQQYADMNAGMDHALARLLPADRALPSNLALPTSHKVAVESWRVLTEVFEARRLKLQQKEGKRRLKEEAKRQKLKKKQASESKKGSAEPKKSDKVKSAKADAQDGKKRKKPVKPDVKPDVKAVAKTLASPRSSPSSPANSFLSPDSMPTLLAKLREQAGLERLVMGTTKYNALVRWLEVDQAKNLPVPRDLLTFVARLRARENSGHDKKSNGKKPIAAQKRAKEETLDDRLRAERKKKILEVARPRSSSSASRKRRVVDEEEEQKGRDSDEEPEYADGYSDSAEEEASDGEAEFEPSVPPREATKQPKRSPNGSSPSAHSPATSKTSATEQLQRVVAKIKEEDLMAKGSDAQYLSYENKASASKKPTKYPGSSPKNAIILDSEEDDSDSVDVEEEKREDSEGDDDNDVVGAESSTDEDQDLFDLNEEDVYIVESILMVKEGRTLFTSNGKRRTKEADLYLVKWDGYDELTWEPESNIPQRLVEFFRDRERSKRACHYQIDKFVERRVVNNVTTNKKEVIYLIQWINQAQAVWEVRSTLPEKTLIWLDKVAGVRGDQPKKRLKIYSSGAR